MISEKELKDNAGEYWELKVVDKASSEEYVPYDKNYPDSCRYLIVSYNTGNSGLQETRLIEDPDYKEAVIKKLKEIHGIVDPWDLEPEKYRKKWEETPWTGFD